MAFIVPLCIGAGWAATAGVAALEAVVYVGAGALAYHYGCPATSPGASEEDYQRRDALEFRVQASLADERSAEEPSPQIAQLQEKLQRLQTEIQAKELDRVEYPVPAFLEQSFKKGTVNIAVTGSSGVGKSSWINSIRKVSSKDPAFAKTGVSETTMEPRMYPFPGSSGVLKRFSLVARRNVSSAALSAVAAVVGSFRSSAGVEQEAADTADDHEPIEVEDQVILQGLQLDSQQHLNGAVATVVRPCDGEPTPKWVVRVSEGNTIIVRPQNIKGVLANCVLWDLPGAGTDEFPQATYVRRMGIRYFDMVILMTADRFLEEETALVRELQHWNIPFFLVRNKIDASIDSKIAEAEGFDDDEVVEEACKKDIENEVISQVKNHFTALDLPIYIISSKPRMRSKHDFQKLERDMSLALANQRCVDMQQECPICFETYAEFGGTSDHTRCAMQVCGHFFCQQCFEVSRECALCREPAFVHGGSASSSGLPSAD